MARDRGREPRRPTATLPRRSMRSDGKGAKPPAAVKQNLSCVPPLRGRWDGFDQRTTDRMARAAVDGCTAGHDQGRCRRQGALAFSKTLPQNPARDWRETSMVDFQAARRAMVDGQIRTSDVTDLRLIAAMLDIPREAFVLPSLAALAYADRDLPLDGDGEIVAGGRSPRLLARPMVQARLIQAADLEPQDRILV